jgi:hypothetical protein
MKKLEKPETKLTKARSDKLRIKLVKKNAKHDKAKLDTIADVRAVVCDECRLTVDQYEGAGLA